MTRDVLALRSMPSDRASAFGGKARSLARLTRKGFPVPPAVGISSAVGTRFLEAVLAPDERLASWLERPTELVDRQALEALVARLESAELGPELTAILRSAYDAIHADAPHGLAVRSSSTIEDETHASSAGVNATVLGASGFDAFVPAVRRCWASLYAPRAVAYARMHARGRVPAMGVVVQAMVPAEIAGVAFSRHPLTGDELEIVVESSYGLGCSVADGDVAPDVVRIDKRSMSVRDRIVGEKRTMSVLGPDGVRVEEVDPAIRSVPSLDDARAIELARLVLRVESELGTQVDVEFAYAAGRFVVLQGRPITTGRRAPARVRKGRPVDRSRFVWSNVNVGESLPGVATPFTWSVLSAFSDLGFRRAFGALGCKVPDDAELVGEFRGRIYLNMSEFMRVIRQVPGIDPRVIGALGGGDFAEQIEVPEEPEGRTAFLARLPMSGTRFLRESLVVDARVAAFEIELANERARVEGIDLRLLSAAALDRTLLDVEHLLDELGGVMLTVYGSLLASVVLLDGWLRIVAGEEAHRLERDLFTGIAAVESAAPGLLLAQLAEHVGDDAAAAAYLRETDPAKLSLAALPDGPTARSLRALLSRYGHRGFREAEIAEPRWREDPNALLRMLRLDARAEGVDVSPLARHRRIAAARLAAEKRLASLVAFPLRPLARALVARVQRLIGLREKLRSEVVAVLGSYRTTILEVSHRILEREPEAGAGAGFFLTLDEVHAFLEGRRDALAPVIQARRVRFERDKALPEPPSTFVGFPPDDAGSEQGGDVLAGLAASGGLAEGTVRVLRSVSDVARFERGDVLVVPSADVGWSPLFVHAAAVVTDLGGPLSHAAIVLRELGVPAVVNVKDATQRLVDGERVRVDGERGEVRRLEASP